MLKSGGGREVTCAGVILGWTVSAHSALEAQGSAVCRALYALLFKIFKVLEIVPRGWSCCTALAVPTDALEKEGLLRANV